MFARRALSAAAARVAPQRRWESVTAAAAFCFAQVETALKYAKSVAAVAVLAKKLAKLAEVRFTFFLFPGSLSHCTLQTCSCDTSPLIL